MSTTERGRVQEILLRYERGDLPLDIAVDRLAARLEGEGSDELLQLVLDHGFEPMGGVRLVDWLAGRLEGEEVVAAGWMDADELRWFQQGDFDSTNVYRFEPHYTPGEEDPPIPVALVRRREG